MASTLLAISNCSVSFGSDLYKTGVCRRKRKGHSNDFFQAKWLNVTFEELCKFFSITGCDILGS